MPITPKRTSHRTAHAVSLTSKIVVGGEQPCFIVAEIGQNHQGNLGIAKNYIRVAKVSL